MQLILRLNADASPALHSRRQMTPASRELLRATEELGVTIEPLHPSCEDPHLINYFKVEAADRAHADQLISRLRHIKAVESIYLKPEDGLP